MKFINSRHSRRGWILPRSRLVLRARILSRYSKLRLSAKVKNIKAVKALLDIDALKYNEADNSVIGLNEQLDKIKSSDAYLFPDYQEPPRIVAGGNQTRLNTDAMTSAMRQAAGLSQGK